mmetsp:Transcript_1868/g.2155  ORF Transcript_1868/g.2155 Transcript_1868/m.2155 type:complete len:167 (+) Transcript_1868:251-751(+)|eukprot:CAMPEP_0184014868 /NCGR_PEP_ID=MMETSP0954-20121128/5954_1 /TAXON_ID=627963 /ORGANISM="Aplanochytrium sp, Strain PBS07" /LENGTH=166 /DNA_ID=CAMNT_0026295509 /DNA_START=246 /DNA_END=746 /DNA_ORIENTATION=+
MSALIDSSVFDLPSNHLVAICATGLAGLLTGGLCFVSAVSTRSYGIHLDNKESTAEEKAKFVKKSFQVWWPSGRDYMFPLICTTTATHISSWYVTGQKNWLVSGAFAASVAVYTATILGEDISSLMKASSKDVEATARRFCNLHHFRPILAGISFGLSLLTLVKCE